MKDQKQKASKASGFSRHPGNSDFLPLWEMLQERVEKKKEEDSEAEKWGHGSVLLSKCPDLGFFLQCRPDPWVLYVSHLIHGTSVSTIWSMGFVWFPSDSWVFCVTHMSHGSCMPPIWFMGIVCHSSDPWVLYVSHLIHGSCMLPMWSIGLAHPSQLLYFQIWSILVKDRAF